MSNRNCIVILSLSNLTGTLNHLSSSKLRIDYNKLLTYLTNGRNLLGAYVVSQHEVTYCKNQNNTTLQRNQAFLQNLTNFGWTPIKVSYDISTGDMTPVSDAIWKNVLTPFVNESGELTIDPVMTDVIFVNGSAGWFDIINAFFTYGFSVEVNYIKNATSKQLMRFAFFDLTQWIMETAVQCKSKIKGDSVAEFINSEA